MTTPPTKRPLVIGMACLCALAVSFQAKAQVAASSAESRAQGPEIAPHAPQPHFILEALVNTGTFTSAGVYDTQGRGFLEILGGTFKGPDIQGTILPSNRDWPNYYPNGARTTDVDYIYKTDDGVLIFVSVDGWRYGKTMTGPLADYEKAHPGGNLLRAFVKLRAPVDERRSGNPVCLIHKHLKTLKSISFLGVSIGADRTAFNPIFISFYNCFV